MSGTTSRDKTKPLPYFPETAWAWLNADDEKAETTAKQTYEGHFKFTGERRDAYMSRCYPDLEPVYDAMTELAVTFMQPMLAYLEEVK